MENRIELGSEFNLSLNDLQIARNNLFAYMSGYETEWFDYGRSAIKEIPVPRGKQVLLPEYICESVINCFPKEMVRFYTIDKTFRIDLDSLLSKLNSQTGCIYIVHYFGYLQEPEIIKIIKKEAQKIKAVVVEDTTQSLFSEHELYGDYGAASVRKWMPTPMGGVLYRAGGVKWTNILGKEQNNDNTKAYGMVLKDLFLRTSYDTNAKYREIFTDSEKNIDLGSDARFISDFAKFLISCVDIDRMKTKRKNNFRRLRNALEKAGLNPVKEFMKNETPFVYPLRVKNRDRFRKYLIDNRIYCAIHWPFDGIHRTERENAEYNAETLISLPIDQRYGETEIDYMADTICNYWR